MNLLQDDANKQWTCISCGQKFPSRFDAVNHFCVSMDRASMKMGDVYEAFAAMSGGGARGATQAVDCTQKPPGRQLLNDQYALSNDGMSITCTQCGESFYDMDDVSAHVCPVKTASVGGDTVLTPANSGYTIGGTGIVPCDPAKELVGEVGQMDGVVISTGLPASDPTPPERNPIDDVMEITRRFFGG